MSKGRAWAFRHMCSGMSLGGRQSRSGALKVGFQRDGAGVMRGATDKKAMSAGPTRRRIAGPLPATRSWSPVERTAPVRSRLPSSTSWAFEQAGLEADRIVEAVGPQAPTAVDNQRRKS